MRIHVLACGLGALALAALVSVADPASAAKSKMGCTIGKEKWDAVAGKCVPGKSKYMRAAASKAPKAAKKAPEKK